jgi:Bifunctional DNA primase/polymerase, N-terminal
VVIDTDTKQGHPDLKQDGEVTLQQIQAANRWLPDTLMSESPSGSLHRYYLYPAAALMQELGLDHIRSFTLEPGVDIKADGGMVLLPPSARHRDGHYCWRNEQQAPEVTQAAIDEINSGLRREGIEPIDTVLETPAMAELPLWWVKRIGRPFMV